MTASFEFDAADVARFLALVDVLPSGCYYWLGARSRGKGNRKWYPTFCLSKGRKRIRGHRFACEAVGGRPPLPRGWHRDHTCCFSMCVNEAHIVYVTHEENQRRKIERRTK